MFKSTRLKLTLWYLLIIMIVSVAFSAVIYRVLTFELDRLLERQAFRLGQQRNDPDVSVSTARGWRFSPPLIDPELVAETKQRLVLNLVALNGLILIGTGGLGYILAGKTLKPIKRMVDEQHRFVADASHELRTPITALKTTLEVSLRDKSLSLKEVKQLLHENLDQVNRLQKLSDALLTLAQLEPKTDTQTLSHADVVPVASAAVRRIKPLAAAKNIRLDHRLEPATVRIPPDELEEVLSILLDNAIKYSHAKSAIAMTGSVVSGRQYRLIVKDHGIGISQEHISHLFDRFYRVDASRGAESSNGYGLGLAIAQQIAKRNNTIITVSSQVDKGSTFALKLPLDG